MDIEGNYPDLIADTCIATQTTTQFFPTPLNFMLTTCNPNLNGDNKQQDIELIGRKSESKWCSPFGHYVLYTKHSVFHCSCFWSNLLILCEFL
jgi:hypothetical protein